MSKRILVIANETVESPILRQAVRAAEPERVAVVAPALNSRVRHWLSDVDGARHAAEARLERSLDELAHDGVEAYGWVGDSDPFQAIVDAIHLVDVDEIVIATHPEGRSNWLARDLVGRVRRGFARPVLHIVVDAEQRVEYVAGRGRARARPLPRKTAQQVAST